MAIEIAVGLLVFRRCILRLHRATNRLAAENARQVQLAEPRDTVFFTQAVTQLCKQGVMRDERQIININFVGMAFTAGCAHRDEIDFLLKRPDSHSGFGFDLVTCVQH